MTTPIVAPYVPSYANRQSYITAAEFIQDPNGVDVSQLVAGGSVFDNNAALIGVIADASAWVDAICEQILAATIDIQVGRYRIDRDGNVKVPCDYSPVIAVNAVSTGDRPQDLAAVTDLTGTWIRPKVVQIPVVQTFYDRVGYASGDLYVEMTYVNGYANTTLADAANPGDTTIVVTGPLGIAPNMNLGCYDGSTSEPLVVSSSYSYGSSTVPLASPLANGHAAGTAVSALPPEVRRATKLLTSALIKTRGDEAFQMASISAEPETTALGQPGLTRDVEIATRLLARFRRVR